MGDEYIEDLSIPPPDSYVEWVMQRKGWIEEGTCRGVDPDLFFPERGESTKEAKGVCETCPIKRHCLEYAVQGVEKFGIWGGKSERERRRIRRERRQYKAQAAAN
jgi:WhiB family redox-sensing transcriptional regulator